MEKYYINELENVLQFDGADFELGQDDNGIYTDDESMYEWLKELDNAIDTLEDNDVDVLALEVNEYDDYIKMAKEFQ